MEEKGIFGGVWNYCQPSKAWFDELHLILNVQLFSLCPYRYPELIETKRGEKQGLRALQLLLELKCIFLSVLLIGNLNHLTFQEIGSS